MTLLVAKSICHDLQMGHIPASLSCHICDDNRVLCYYKLTGLSFRLPGSLFREKVDKSQPFDTLKEISEVLPISTQSSSINRAYCANADDEPIK